MYWNSCGSRQALRSFWINRNMGCIEMSGHSCLLGCIQKINRNMGCIEIIRRTRVKEWLNWLIETWDVLKSINADFTFNTSIRLIETWDVLKSVSSPSTPSPTTINRNMGCIEIVGLALRQLFVGQINRNMGCIEIQWTFLTRRLLPRLIETWDVLKYGA